MIKKQKINLWKNYLEVHEDELDQRYLSQTQWDQVALEPKEMKNDKNRKPRSFSSRVNPFMCGIQWEITDFAVSQAECKTESLP